MAQLVEYAVKIKATILLIQDPHVKEGKIAGFPIGWNIFTSKNCTAAILVTDKSLQCVEAHKTENAIFVNFTENQNILTVGTQYSVPTRNLREDLDSWGSIGALNYNNMIVS